MTEELKIQIKAVTADAKKKIADVKKEIQETAEKAKEARESLAEAFSKVGAGAAVAVGAITAVTAAMVGLNKNTEEFRKAQAKVNTAFQAMGSNAKQASKTYGELYRFLGDDANTAETAQSLALITTNEKELAEWTKILQGVYGAMGDKLPINSLAEAANETLQVGKVTGSFADALNWAGVSEDAFNEKLEKTATLAEREALIRNTLNGLYGDSAALYEANNAATLQQNESQYRLNAAMAEAAKYTVPLMTALNNLGATLLNSFGRAIQTVCAYIAVFVQWIAQAASWVGSFFGMFSKSTAVNEVGAAIESATKSTKGLGGATAGLNTALGKAAGAAKELKKQTMGFDELNVVSSQTASGGAASGGAAGGAPSLGAVDLSGAAAAVEDITGGFSQKMDEAREKLEGILTLVGLIALGVLAWKLANVSDWAKVGETLKTAGGYALIIAGALLLIQGYSDAWVNGLDWGNFAMILGGIGAIVGGLALAIGPIAAAIGTIVGGVALLVIGIKDLVTNGYSMEGVLAVLTGAILVAVGVMWAFNAALLANPITWIIVGIAALVAAIVILWNECDWFKNAIITAWNWIIDAFKAVGNWLKTFFTETIPNFFKNIINFVKENWLGLLLLIVNPFQGAFKLLYDNCDGFREFIDKWVDKIGSFFADLWAGIKETFSQVGSFFKDTFTKAWTAVKNVFSAGGKIFDGIKEGIVSTFKVVVNGIITGINKVVKLPFEGLNSILSKIHKIEIVGIKPFDWLTWRAPIPQLPKLATGGIITKESLFIGGEGGKKEAVLPLEQNTEWIDMLADRLAGRNAAPTKLVLNVDGKQLGYATIGAINDITKQTGSLQLTLA